MRYTVEVREDGTFWFKEGTTTLHREDGPAVVWANGTKCWYIDGRSHRVDGPAVEATDGSKYWYINGILHREDGPAIEWADGRRHWVICGRLHREDGPAVEWASGLKEWFINGARLSEQDFIAQTSPAKELTIAEIEQLLGHRVKVVK